MKLKPEHDGCEQVDAAYLFNIIKYDIDSLKKLANGFTLSLVNGRLLLASFNDYLFESI